MTKVLRNLALVVLALAVGLVAGCGGSPTSSPKPAQLQDKNEVKPA